MFKNVTVQSESRYICVSMASQSRKVEREAVALAYVRQVG